MKKTEISAEPLGTDRSHWRRVQFGDVVVCANENSRNPLQDGLTRYVGLEHLEPNDLKIAGFGEVADGTTFTRVFRAGQVLFGKRRSYQRKAAVADFDGVCSGDILTFATRPDLVLPDLLPLIVQSDGFFAKAVGTSAGSLSPRTKWSELARYEFILPPLAEQRRIADVLWAVEECLSEMSGVLRCTERLGQTTADALLDKECQWQRLKIGDAGAVILGRQRSPNFQTGNFTKPYIRVANVYDGRFELADVLSMDFNTKHFERFKLRKGNYSGRV